MYLRPLLDLCHCDAVVSLSLQGIVPIFNLPIWRYARKGGFKKYMRQGPDRDIEPPARREPRYLNSAPRYRLDGSRIANVREYDCAVIAESLSYDIARSVTQELQAGAGRQVDCSSLAKSEIRSLVNRLCHPDIDFAFCIRPVLLAPTVIVENLKKNHPLAGLYYLGHDWGTIHADTMDAYLLLAAVDKKMLIRGEYVHFSLELDECRNGDIVTDDGLFRWSTVSDGICTCHAVGECRLRLVVEKPELQTRLFNIALSHFTEAE